MSELLDSDLNNEPKPSDKKKILKINLGILAFYTIFCIILGKEGGFIMDAFFIVAHVAICLLVGIIQSIVSKGDTAKEWFLSAILVLLIGFGTCVGFGSLSGF